MQINLQLGQNPDAAAADAALARAGLDTPTESAVAEPENLAGWQVPCEIWSRIVGYYRPTDSWNAGKQQEYVDRLPFDM